MIKNHFPTCWVSGSYAFEQQRESKLIHFPTCWVSGSYAFEQQRESKRCTPVMKNFYQKDDNH